MTVTSSLILLKNITFTVDCRVCHYHINKLSLGSTSFDIYC